MKTLTRLPLLTPELEKRTRSFREGGVLQDGEILIVDTVAERYLERDPEILLGLALAFRAPRLGHVAVDLRKVASQTAADQEFAEHSETPVKFAWPADIAGWEARVLESAMVQRSDEERSEPRPFVVQPVGEGRNLLMTRRMWCEQRRLADALLALPLSPPTPVIPEDAVENGIRTLGIEGQGAEAIRAAARGRLTVVTGGPGTGKTYSIKRLLALLLSTGSSHEKRLHVELAAPTGKAAVRMAEAMSEGLEALEAQVSPAVVDTLRNLQPRTLHKLLGMRRDGTSRHGRDNPISADVLVVDEVSMVDLTLMRRLVEAVPPGARLVLLGDRDQLASVDAGCVLADLVRDTLDGTADGAAEGALADSIVSFDKSYRFKSAPMVASISRSLQRRDDDELASVCDSLCADSEYVRYLGPPQAGRASPSQLDALALPYLSEHGYAHELSGVLGSPDQLRARDTHLALLTALDRYRVLAAHRRGPLGVTGLLRELEQRVRVFLVKARRSELPRQAGFWLGQTLLITENAYEVGLMNGDIGLVLPDDSGQLTAVFPTSAHGTRGAKNVALSRLPRHQGALAMTVHKSQGSQFERVALVLAGRPSPIQTRELIYTGVTRSSRSLDLLGSREELEEALKRRVQRASGLSELLRMISLGGNAEARR